MAAAARTAWGKAMRWYKRDPAAALEGMIGLTLEERGAYNTLIDLIYARAPHGSVDDHLVSKALAIRKQKWLRLKQQLIHKGKVHETEDGKLTANRADKEILTALKLIEKTTLINRVSELKSAEINHLAGGVTNRRRGHNHNHNQNTSFLEEAVRAKRWVK